MGMGPPQHNPDALASGQSEHDHSIAFFDVALIQARRASEGIYKPDAQAREYFRGFPDPSLARFDEGIAANACCDPFGIMFAVDRIR